jgi:hypothetical protein
MIPFDNSSLVTPSPIVPMIFKEKENNHRRDSDQAQEDAMKNNHQRQGEENFGNEVMSEVERRNAATHWNDLFDDFKVFGNDYLELLSNFDLKSSTIDSTLDLIMTKQNFYLFYPADSIEFGHGRYLGHLPLYSGSLNSEEIPPDALRLYCDVRTIKIVLHSGLQISFDAFILGRISVNRIPTYWIVVLDEDKYLWALRANGVDEEEVEDDEDRSLDPDPAWPGPQYDEQYVSLALQLQMSS